jgi:hypothetical protein
MPTTTAILFDHHVFKMRFDADAICYRAQQLANSPVKAEQYDLEEVKWAAAKLRHAADYLDDIRRRLEEQS